MARSTLRSSLVMASSRPRGIRTDRRPVAVTWVAGPPGRTQMSTRGGPRPWRHKAVSTGAKTRWSVTVGGEPPRSSRTASGSTLSNMSAPAISSPVVNRARPGTGGSNALTAQVTAVDARTGGSKHAPSPLPTGIGSQRPGPVPREAGVSRYSRPPLPSVGSNIDQALVLAVQRQDQCRLNNRHVLVGSPSVASGHRVRGRRRVQPLMEAGWEHPIAEVGPRPRAPVSPSSSNS